MANAGSNKSARKKRIYQGHCRDQILAGKVNNPNGDWVPSINMSPESKSSIANGYAGTAKKPLR